MCEAGPSRTQMTDSSLGDTRSVYLQRGHFHRCGYSGPEENVQQLRARISEAVTISVGQWEGVVTRP